MIPRIFFKFYFALAVVVGEVVDECIVVVAADRDIVEIAVIGDSAPKPTPVGVWPCVFRIAYVEQPCRVGEVGEFYPECDAEFEVGLVNGDFFPTFTLFDGLDVGLHTCLSGRNAE